MGNLAEQLAAKFQAKEPKRREADSAASDPLARFAAIVEDATGVEAEAIDRDARLREDLGISSLALVEVTVRCEDAFGVTLDDRTIASFVKVGDFLDYLTNHQA